MPSVGSEQSPTQNHRHTDHPNENISKKDENVNDRRKLLSPAGMEKEDRKYKEERSNTKKEAAGQHGQDTADVVK